MTTVTISDAGAHGAAAATDRIPASKVGVKGYLTPEQIKDYILGLANTWAAKQTITPAANSQALVVSGYSLTDSDASSIIDLAGTWNTTGTPTAIKLNVTDTASDAASRLMDLQVGGSSKFYVDKMGGVFATRSDANTAGQHRIGPVILETNGNGGVLRSTDAQFTLKASSTEVVYVTGSGIGVLLEIALGGSATGRDVKLARDAANVLALRNSANAQTFRLYNTYTDASNYERGFMRWNSNVFEIGTAAAGTGSNRSTAFTDAAISMANLPTADPAVAGRLWNNSGVLTVSAG